MTMLWIVSGTTRFRILIVLFIHRSLGAGGLFYCYVVMWFNFKKLSTIYIDVKSGDKNLDIQLLEFFKTIDDFKVLINGKNEKSG